MPRTGCTRHLFTALVFGKHENSRERWQSVFFNRRDEILHRRRSLQTFLCPSCVRYNIIIANGVLFTCRRRSNDAVVVIRAGFRRAKGKRMARVAEQPSQTVRHSLNCAFEATVLQ